MIFHSYVSLPEGMFVILRELMNLHVACCLVKNHHLYACMTIHNMLCARSVFICFNQSQGVFFAKSHFIGIMLAKFLDVAGFFVGRKDPQWPFQLGIPSESSLRSAAGLVLRVDHPTKS